MRSPVACRSLLLLCICLAPLAASRPARADTPSLSTRFDYLLWDIRRHPLTTPLGTYTFGVPFPVGTGGTLGDPTTFVGFGDREVGTDARSGGRFSADLWMDDDQTYGFEFSYLFLGNQTDSSRAGSDPSQPFTYGVPFFDAAGVLTGGVPGEAFISLGIPGVTSGRSRADFSTFVQGAEINAILWTDTVAPGVTLTPIAGFRYAQIRERLQLTNELVVPGLAGLSFEDRFQTTNDFYGGQIGARVELEDGMFFVRLTAKVALGDMRQTVAVGGETKTAGILGAPPALPGGLFAQASNSGSRTRDDFAVLPELIVQGGLHVTECLRMTLGYNLLVATSVVRPGDQIDRRLNLLQSPMFNPGVPVTGPLTPRVPFHDRTFWAQGVSCGLELSF